MTYLEMLSEKEIEKPKIEFVECNIKEWYLNHKEKDLYVVYGDEICTHHGIFKGLENLTDEEYNLFKSNKECFYNYGKMCHIGENTETCECLLSREYSSIIVEFLTNIDDYDIFSKVIKPILIDLKIDVEE